MTTLFTDDEFPPDDSSYGEGHPIDWDKYEWVRSKDIMGKLPRLFYQGVDPNDIQ